VVLDLIKPIEKTRLYDSIVDQIKDLILQGKLKPGDKLPSERDLAQLFHVGRPTVREAIRTLKLIGLVDVNQGQRGTVVKKYALEPYRESMREQMRWLIQTRKTTIEQLTEVRSALDTSIALLAAERASKADLRDMRLLLREMEVSTNSSSAYLEKAIGFHKLMAISTGNPIFHAIWTAFTELVIDQYQELLDRMGKDIIKKLYLTNLQIYRAILAKDRKKIRAAVDGNIKLQGEILSYAQESSI